MTGYPEEDLTGACGGGRQKGCGSWVTVKWRQKMICSQMEVVNARYGPVWLLTHVEPRSLADVWGVCVLRIPSRHGAGAGCSLLCSSNIPFGPEHTSTWEVCVVLPSFPRVSTALEQIHIFNTSATAELCLQTWHQWQWNAIGKPLSINGIPLKFPEPLTQNYGW